jgi:hypothetical protein
MTATPTAPAARIDGALAAVIPPIPITGIPRGASRSSAANPAGPKGGPASGFDAVMKQGPMLQ